MNSGKRTASDRNYILLVFLGSIFCVTWFININHHLESSSTKPKNIDVEPADFRPAMSYLGTGVEFQIEPSNESENFESIFVPNSIDFEHPDPVCDTQFDYGLLRWWTDADHTFQVCKSTFEGFKYSGTIKCFVTHQEHLNAVTAPHVTCRGDNIFLNPNLTRPGPCPKHRPRYKCSGNPTYRLYHKGAFASVCQPTFRLSDFPNDHLTDIFDSFVMYDDPAQIHPWKVFADRVLVMITREKIERDDLFHVVIDWFMLYQTIVMHRLDIGRIQILFLDDHPPSIFDEFMKTVFSPNFPLLRWSDFKGQVAYTDVVWVPPSYSNIINAKISDRCPAGCCQPLAVFHHFSVFTLQEFDLMHTSKEVYNEHLIVVFVSRKLYGKRVFVGRQILNEDELVEIIKKDDRVVRVRKVDFAELSLKDQLSVMSSSDIIVGMYGSGMAHAIFLPYWGGMLEIHAPGRAPTYEFEHIAHWRGLEYQNCTEIDSTETRGDGDYHSINVEAFQKSFHELAGAVLEEKLAAD